MAKAERVMENGESLKQLHRRTLETHYNQLPAGGSPEALAYLLPLIPRTKAHEDEAWTFALQKMTEGALPSVTTRRKAVMVPDRERPGKYHRTDWAELTLFDLQLCKQDALADRLATERRFALYAGVEGALKLRCRERSLAIAEVDLGQAFSEDELEMFFKPEEEAEAA